MTNCRRTKLLDIHLSLLELSFVQIYKVNWTTSARPLEHIHKLEPTFLTNLILKPVAITDHVGQSPALGASTDDDNGLLKRLMYFHFKIGLKLIVLGRFRVGA
jgi:hypothetical protein